MRVITGSARGRKLCAPDGYDVRPTTDKVKEAVFSSLQFDIGGALVLDLFAGSGQLGIEALSRGARHAVFVDNSRVSLGCVRKNLEATDFVSASDVLLRDSFDYIALTERSFDIIFLDPPYGCGIVEKILPLAAKKLAPGGFIVCEYEAKAQTPQIPGGPGLFRDRQYGRIKISVFHSEDPSPEEDDVH